MKSSLFLGLLAAIPLVGAEPSDTATLPKPAGVTVIRLEADSPGRVFEGIGAVSAGANTRNLPDYPEKERSEVLDYLFKPKFGAALQHLKVEIGGGDNSTCGSEPSHVITREELANPKPRGYEFWFMAEARKRNPAIQLDCLPWCYPGWISDRFSQDSADWFAAFLDVAKKHYGLNLDWVAAAQNECGTDLQWVAHVLRPTLDRRGHDQVKIQGPDDAKRPLWAIFEEFPKDPAYDRVLQAVGYHYPSNWLPEIENDKYAAPDAVKATGKPLWASEEFSMSGRTWDNALLWARLINKNYIRDRITKSEAWCPVDSLTPGIMWEGTGLMEANQPWSGHYKVWPAIWTTAHTTQFAEPGWRYLDSACGKFDPATWKGTYVALANPKTSDWSVILCTDKPETVSVRVGDGLKTGPVRVWKSTADAQFIRQPDALPKEGQLELTLDQNALYTLTTTDGQSKGGWPAPPEAKPFPFPYHEDFEACTPGQTPPRLSDQKGTFETVARPGGGVCLQQIVPKQGILWFPKFRTPFTVWGDKNWTDYTVTADVLIKGGVVELGGRWLRTGVTDFRLAELHETRITLRHDGAWELLTPETVEFEEKGKKKTKTESRVKASGTLANFDPQAWHTLSVTFAGASATASIDGRLVATCPAGGAGNGLPFLASSYAPNCFDNLAVTPAKTVFASVSTEAPASETSAVSAPGCEVFLSHSDVADLRRRVQQKTEPTYTAYLSLQREAEAQLKREPHVPAEWYVPGAYKDPAGHIKAKDSLSKDANSAYALALMYRMTDEQKYALAAIRLIDGWAAGLHGMSRKDDSRLSFSYHFPAFIFAAALVDGCAGWPQVKKQAFRDFVRTQALPMNTMESENNWGNWGLVLVLSSAVYLHDETLYQAGLERWKHFIETQIAADGSLPLEVVRNNGQGERGLWYTHFCLMPQTIAAEIARVHGDDLFDYRSANGHSLRQAYERVVPWTFDPRQFPYYKGQDPNGQKGSDYISYWEILNGHWPQPEAARLLAAKRPLNASHCTPFLTFTHGK